MDGGILANWPDPPATARERLAHTLQAYAPWPDEMVMVQVTTSVYGPGVVTGLTLGDLRVISSVLSFADVPDSVFDATEEIPIPIEEES